MLRAVDPATCSRPAWPRTGSGRIVQASCRVRHAVLARARSTATRCMPRAASCSTTSTSPTASPTSATGWCSLSWSPTTCPGSLGLWFPALGLLATHGEPQQGLDSCWRRACPVVVHALRLRGGPADSLSAARRHPVRQRHARAARPAPRAPALERAERHRADGAGHAGSARTAGCRTGWSWMRRAAPSCTARSTRCFAALRGRVERGVRPRRCRSGAPTAFAERPVPVLRATDDLVTAAPAPDRMLARVDGLAGGAVGCAASLAARCPRRGAWC